MEQVAVKAWGNSQGIRIPKEILDKLDIYISDMLQLGIENDAIVLKKVYKHKTFEDRMAEFDGKISVIDYDWGEPRQKDSES